MFFGAGHIQDMINRMKQNRAQLHSNRSKFKENYQGGIYSKKEKSKKPNFKKIPEKELNKIKKRIRENAKVEQKRQRIAIGILMLFGIVFLAGMLFLLNHSPA